MGKSQFKFAADQVINQCIGRALRNHKDSDYYWAYVHLFTEFNNKFDQDKFDDYIIKRI
jgi:hypothetical protein